ncbi:DUF4176 domain-containing protein [Lachnospira multipara]|uniref:DUF4176 domain-containing protein n=1 Tax=Lachnospira multipara TaxID=28051 RepID=UPI0004863163|nr:DUF4176 domain-containing protein [Lachnospira multipara]
MINRLLPIGSVVLVSDMKKKLMIVGFCQKGGHDPNAVWDYTGVLFPEGYYDSENMFLFNNDQISQIYALGYQDEEQIKFIEKAEQILDEIKNE